jgi:hypothetical protein
MDNSLFIRTLIERQRRLVGSADPSVRIRTLWIAAMLDDNLLRCTNRQIADLLPLVQERLCLFEPEMALCEHARRRLLGSVGGIGRNGLNRP